MLTEFQQYYGNAGVLIYAQEDADRKARNARLQERKIIHAKKAREALSKLSGGDAEKPVVDNEPDEPSATFDSKSFTWEKMNYFVPVPGGTRRLLHDVNGYVKPGTLTALMGSSGAGMLHGCGFETDGLILNCAGKTTCLDVLAQRKNIGLVSGDLLQDGKPLPADFARRTAYGA